MKTPIQDELAYGNGLPDYRTELTDNRRTVKWVKNEIRYKVYGKCRVWSKDNKMQSCRRMWKCKVLSNEESTIDFKIGICKPGNWNTTNIYTERKDSYQDLNLSYERTRRFYDNKVKVGDIITILLIQNDKLWFKQNDKIVGLPINVSSGFDPCCLMIAFNSNTTLQLLGE